MVRGLRSWARSTAAPRRADRSRRPRRLVGRGPPGPARGRRVRLRGAAQRVRRRHRRAAHRQHGGDAHRLRRPRHGVGDRDGRPRSGAGRRRPAGRHGVARALAGAVGRLGAVRRRRGCRSPWPADRVPRSRQLGAVARQAGTPVSLHGTGGAWLVAGELRRRRALPRRRRQLARPQGVQHVERVLHPGRARRSRRRVPRRASTTPPSGRGDARPVCTSRRRRGRPSRRTASAEEIKVPAGRRRARRAGGVDDRRRRPRAGVGVGALARGRRSSSPPTSTPPSRCATGTARASSPRSSARTPASATASTPPSTPRSSATASPAGSTASTPSTRRSSACPTGRAGGCWPVAACCRATRCTPCATAPTSSIPSCAADGAARRGGAVAPGGPARGVLPTSGVRTDSAQPASTTPATDADRRRRTTTTAGDDRAHRRRPPADPTASTVASTNGKRRRAAAIRCSRSSVRPTSTSVLRRAAGLRPRRPAPQGTVTISPLVDRPPRRAGPRRHRPRPSTRSPSTARPATFEQTDDRAVRSIRRNRSGPAARSSIAVTYHDDEHASRQFGLGVGWYPTDDGSYVLNEPDGARTWLPSNDHPRTRRRGASS